MNAFVSLSVGECFDEKSYSFVFILKDVNFHDIWMFCERNS